MGLSLSDRFAMLRQEEQGQKSKLTNIDRPNMSPRKPKVIISAKPAMKKAPRGPPRKSFVPKLAQQKIEARNDQSQTSDSGILARKIASRAKTQLSLYAGVSKRNTIQKERQGRLSGYPLAAITQALLEASSEIVTDMRQNVPRTQNAIETPKAVAGKQTSLSRLPQQQQKTQVVHSRLGVQARLGKKLPADDLRIKSAKLSKNKDRQLAQSKMAFNSNRQSRNVNQGFLDRMPSSSYRPSNSWSRQKENAQQFDSNRLQSGIRSRSNRFNQRPRRFGQI